MTQVELSKIIIDEKRQEQIIVLKEKEGNRQFPIIIGFLEASSIKMKLSGISVPRPMTHDLLLSVIEGLDAKLEKLVIDNLVESTFFAKLIIKGKDGEIRSIDSRPSDGVALAVRSQIPIFVENEVIKKAAFIKTE